MNIIIYTNKYTLSNMENNNKSSKLWMIPNALHNGYENLPSDYYNFNSRLHVQNIAVNINYWLVENAKTARDFLKSLNLPLSQPLQQQKILVIGDIKENEVLSFLKDAQQNQQDIGVLSEAGLPAIADPGSTIVALAHKINLPVMPLVGPCSITLALMASGFNGQSFVFHGYMPIDNSERNKAIQFSEKNSKSHKQTQICIETPYRNVQFMQSLLQNLKPDTRLCIGADITLDSQTIISKTVAEWKSTNKNVIDALHKKPCIFLWLA